MFLLLDRRRRHHEILRRLRCFVRSHRVRYFLLQLVLRRVRLHHRFVRTHRASDYHLRLLVKT